MANHKATAANTEPALPPIDTPGLRRLPPLLRHAWYGLNQAFRRRIAHLDLTPDQFTVLRWLIESDPQGVTQRQLADLMSSDPNTVTSVLNRMEQAGMIERKPHESDRRAKRVRITRRGRGIYEKARDIAVDLQGQVLTALPLDRREPFLHELQLVAEACRQAAEKSTPHHHDEASPRTRQ